MNWASYTLLGFLFLNLMWAAIEHKTKVERNFLSSFLSMTVIIVLLYYAGFFK